MYVMNVYCVQASSKPSQHLWEGEVEFNDDLCQLLVCANMPCLQADALGDSLRSKGMNANVYVGMRYWHPFTEEALEQIKRDNVGRLVILPLYPQFSISTSGSSLRLLVGGVDSNRHVSLLVNATAS